MFNLLPESIRSDIKNEYKTRRLLLVLLFIVSLQVTQIIFVFPSWINLNSKIIDSKNRVAQLNSSKILNASTDIKPVITNINNELNLIDKSLEYPKLLPILGGVLSQKSSYVKINQFSYMSTGTSTATINIKGVSATRESLVEFKKSLDDLKMFKVINLPISNYARDKDIEFSMDLIY
jgi:hypothetical protein